MIVCCQLLLDRVVEQPFKVGVAFGHTRIVVADHGRRVLGRAASKDYVGAIRVAVVVEVQLLVETAGVADGPPSFVEVGERGAVEPADNMIAHDLDAAFVSHLLQVGFPLQQSLSCSRHDKMEPFLVVLRTEEADRSAVTKSQVDVRPFEVEHFLTAASMFHGEKDRQHHVMPGFLLGCCGEQSIQFVGFQEDLPLVLPLVQLLDRSGWVACDGLLLQRPSHHLLDDEQVPVR